MRYLVLGEFERAAGALRAIRELRARGHRAVDLHSPYPVEGAADALGLPRPGLRVAALVCGLAGAAGGYALQWYANARSYPINVGDRPLHAAPAFVPLAFEGLVLAASLAIFATLVLSLRLPNLHHPALGVEAFRSSSGGRFWVSVAAAGAEERP